MRASPPFDRFDDRAREIRRGRAAAEIAHRGEACEQSLPSVEERRICLVLKIAKRSLKPRLHPIVQSFEPGEDWFWDYASLKVRSATADDPDVDERRAEPGNGIRKDTERQVGGEGCIGGIAIDATEKRLAETRIAELRSVKRRPSSAKSGP